MKHLWESWFRSRGWKPFGFQRAAWKAYGEGASGLVHAPTGLGKTYAVWGGPVLDWLDRHPHPERWPREPESIQVLWLTPLRALANDTAESLRAPLTDLGIPWSVELRTGDTSTAVRRRQAGRLPTALVTTPESLSLLLSHEDAEARFSSLRCVIVDEWHELLGTKRGVQAELGLARLRRWIPGLRTWGLSATLGNLREAMEVLLGPRVPADAGRLIASTVRKRFELETLIPSNMERFPWSGHLGLGLLPEVIRRLEGARTTLLFTNTRSQTELWFQALRSARPDWENQVAIHHGSIDRELRESVENRLRAGTVRCVVCTASLDLGVDFSPVEQVIQVGGPKGVARLLQRAGRSGHQPGGTSRILCVPAHALELVEFAGVRQAIRRGELEAREPLKRPLDLLAQHLVTIGLGGGFTEREMLEEVRSCHAFADLDETDWKWTLDFVSRGGASLKAYPQFRKLEEVDGRYVVRQPRIGQLHRMSIGTIVSEQAILVKLLRGGYLGTVEEGFVARLKPGDVFVMAGQRLELVRIREMTAWVRKARERARFTPQWMGGRMPLSSQLATAVLRLLDDAGRGRFEGREMRAVRPVLRLQAAWSRIPRPGEMLVEATQTREGFHYFIYPFAGRLAHEGLAALAAFRLAVPKPRSFALTMNDYGFALSTPDPLELEDHEWRRVFSPEKLLEDLDACLNASELARRQFRDIARIAGLVFQGYPGAGKTARQIQASSGLFFDVFVRYEPDNRLLAQARREVLERQLEVRRLRESLERAQSLRWVVQHTERLTPLAFPLWAMWIQGQLSTEAWGDRIRRMVEQLEEAAGPLEP